MSDIEDKDERKIVQLSEQDLRDAGFIGDDAPESVRTTVETARRYPALLPGLTVFMVDCQNLAVQQEDVKSTISLALSDTGTAFSQLTITSTDTLVPPHLVSEFERTHYYNGVSMDPPELLYRSDLDTNPFPVPEPGAKFFALPEKTAEGVFNTKLNAVWGTVAPKIIAVMKQRGIKRSALKAARFSTRDEYGKQTLGPIVIWIALHPGKNTAADARDASPDILQILGAHGVKDAVVEWYEGSVEKLSGPALMRVADETNPTFYVRRAFTAALGMPIATKEREKEDSQGSVSFFFYENKDKNGDPSARVFAVSNKHVLRADTTIDYQFQGAGAARQYVRICGMRRFQRAVDEIRALVASKVAEAVRLTAEIGRLEAQTKSDDPEQAEEDMEALEKKKIQLKEVESDNAKLQTFWKEVNTQWHDIACRNIGIVDWAPRISIDVDDRAYTLDIGTVELDALKFKKNFKGNVVDLGNKFTSHDLNIMFWPNDSNSTGIKFPSDRMLKINGVVSRELLATPDCFDENGYPQYIVGKDGNTTDFTVGRYAGLEAYLCDEFGKESIEVAVYNYSKTSGNFSEKGDSGSLIFTGDGRMLAILHSGMPKGFSSHVTYGTPAWWVIEQLKLHYPHADFNRTTFLPAS